MPPSSRGLALGADLVVLCRTVAAVVLAQRSADMSNTNDGSVSPPLPSNQARLLGQVADACHIAIAQAIAQPARAIGLAERFGAAPRRWPPPQVPMGG
jgi:hypothetical protein